MLELVQGKGGKVEKALIPSLAVLLDWLNLLSETVPHCKHAKGILVLSH